ncbi:MAG: MBL fold metallo-hydrolase [Chitinivibrionales bacterium]|nr:MBL fold metallo-hydrolase [Chitinivibrionales bacterium]
MNDSPAVAAQTVAPDTDTLTSYLPVPGFGILPVNAFVIHAAEPVLVDTGMGAIETQFMERLREVIDPGDIRWLWLTHVDPDHLGNFGPIMNAAPRARVVITYLGMGKLVLLGQATDRVHLLRPGQSLDVGDRTLQCLKPPTFDAPETTGLFDSKTKTAFTADCFGALLDTPAANAAEIPSAKLHDGLARWTTADAPWVRDVHRDRFGQTLDRLRRLGPETVLSSHLPPAAGMLDTLLDCLSEARTAPLFEGLDQAGLEQMLAAAEPAGTGAANHSQ